MAGKSRLETREEEISIEIKQLKNNVTRFTKWSWIFVAIGFIILIIGCGLLAFGQFKGFHEFGDFIGGSVGSIWSLAGLFFVYVAFLGQKQSILNQQIEILYNQEELRATRKELAGQKEQMELQNATLKQQQFENTFFQLFNHHTELVKTYKKIDNRKELLDNRALQFEYQTFKNSYKKQYDDNNHNNSKALNNALHNFMYSDITYSFLNSIFQQLLLVDNKTIEDKEYYILLIKSLLTPWSKALIAYFCIHPNHRKLKELVVKWFILDDFKSSVLQFKEFDYKILIETGIITNPS